MNTESQQRPFIFIPALLPDELLFSWIGRLHLLNARSDPRETLQDLFSSKTFIPSADLPCRLQVFSERTAGWGPFGAIDDVIDNGTLFPFYSRFVGAKRRDQLRQLMAFDNGGRLKISMGLLANGFGASLALKCCPECDTDSIAKWGTRIWIRSHQLPGMRFCPTHGCVLTEYIIQSQQSHRQNLQINSFRVRKIDGCEEREKANHSRLSRLLIDALKMPRITISDQDRVHAYFEGAQNLGFGKDGHINWVALAGEIGASHDWFSGMPFRERLLSSPSMPMRWLRDIFLRPERSLHPICHLLLIGVLYKDLSAFFSECKANQEHRPELVDSKFSNSPGAGIDPKFLQLLNNESLSCREVARRTGLCVTSVVLRRRSLNIPISERKKSIYNDKVEEIEKYIKKGLSAAAIAEESHVSLATVYRVRATLGACTWSKDRMKRERRQQWIKEREPDPSKNRTALRASSPATYAWLYRNDRNWLLENCPPRQIPIRLKDPRINWSARDKELSESIYDAVERIRKVGYKRQITISLLMRATGHETMIRRNLLKLPVTRGVLLDSVEQDDKFIKRRREAAIRDLEKETSCRIPEWKILRQSGLRHRKNAK